MSKKYLLDTNILVHLLRGHHGVAERIAQVGWDNCRISEITTKNTAHLSRLEGITIENWIER